MEGSTSPRSREYPPHLGVMGRILLPGRGALITLACAVVLWAAGIITLNISASDTPTGAVQIIAMIGMFPRAPRVRDRPGHGGLGGRHHHRLRRYADGLPAPHWRTGRHVQ